MASTYQYHNQQQQYHHFHHHHNHHHHQQQQQQQQRQHQQRQQKQRHHLPQAHSHLVPSSSVLRRNPIPPPTPLPQHPSADADGQDEQQLSAPATAFALYTYLSTLLVTLGWDSATTPLPVFVTTHSHLLAHELSLPADVATKLFLELWECCTPTIGLVAGAIEGCDEALGCDADTKRGLMRLFYRDMGTSVDSVLKDWSEEEMSVKVAVGTGKRRRRGGWGGWWGEVKGWLCSGKTEKPAKEA